MSTRSRKLEPTEGHAEGSTKRGMQRGPLLFDDSVSMATMPAARKGTDEMCVKCKRLADVMQLSRPSTSSNVRTEPNPAKKTETLTKPETVFEPKLPTLESLQPGSNRLVFVINTEYNPFSIPSKVGVRPKEIKPKSKLKLNGFMMMDGNPSAGAAGTSTRRDVDKNTMLREKSGKKDDIKKEDKWVIKGVRTNRRFELHMKFMNK